MIHTEGSVIIQRPIEEVFDVATNFSRSREWRQGLVRVGLTSDLPVRPGSKFDWVVKLGGQTMDLSGEVTDWDPPTLFTWKPAAGPFPVTGGLRFESTGSGTRVTTYSDSEPTGVMRLASPLMRMIGERQYRSELARLKAILENAPVAG